VTALPPELLAAILRVTGGDEAAARDLAQRWERTLRQTEQAAERIRRQVCESRCLCGSPAEPAPDGRRCSRCYGRLATEEAGG
jgi:hypothetical protein